MSKTQWPLQECNKSPCKCHGRPRKSVIFKSTSVYAIIFDFTKMKSSNENNGNIFDRNPQMINIEMISCKNFSTVHNVRTSLDDCPNMEIVSRFRNEQPPGLPLQNKLKFRNLQVSASFSISQAKCFGYVYNGKIPTTLQKKNQSTETDKITFNLQIGHF